MAERNTTAKPQNARPQKSDAAPKPPLHPYWVLLIALVLPGVGQVLNNTPARGAMFLFFIMSLGWVTMHLAPPDASFVGRYAGGFLIYAISVLDAYKWARYRWAFFHREQGKTDAQRSGQ